MNQKLSQPITESLGVKQGGCKSSEHYKTYISPVIEMIESASLGVWIGPINTGISCCADDILGMTDSPSKLQHEDGRRWILFDRIISHPDL